MLFRSAADGAPRAFVEWGELLDRWEERGAAEGLAGPPHGVLVAAARVDRALVRALLEIPDEG